MAALAELAASPNKVVQSLHDFLVYVNPEPHRRTFLKPFVRNQTALAFSQTGACPAPSSTSAGSGLNKSTGPLLESPYLRPNPLRNNKRVDGLLRSSAKL